MGTKIALIAALCLQLSLVVSAAAADISEKISELKHQGTDFRLRGDHAGADRIGRELKALTPDSGIGYTFSLNTLVTKLTWDGRDTQYDELILEDAQTLLAICIRQISEQPENYLGYYHCGQAHFSLTYLNALRGNYYRAGTNGSSTISRLEQALNLNPDLIDAKMHLGIAYYFADNLPPFVKAFSRYLWFIPTGDSDKSLPYIDDASEHGEYFKDVAKYLYVDLLSNGTELNQELATSHLSDLVSRYPENPRFNLRYISLLIDRGLVAQARIAADQFIDSAVQFERSQQDIDLARLWIIRSHMEQKNLEQAVSLFDEINADLALQTFPTWARSWFALTSAQLADSLNDRDAARQGYQLLIEKHAEFASQEVLSAARAGLKKPFALGR